MKFIWLLIYSYLFYRLAKGVFRLVKTVRQGKKEFRNSMRPNVEEAEFEVLDDDDDDK